MSTAHPAQKCAAEAALDHFSDAPPQWRRLQEILAVRSSAGLPQPPMGSAQPQKGPPQPPGISVPPRQPAPVKADSAGVYAARPFQPATSAAAAGTAGPPPISVVGNGVWQTPVSSRSPPQLPQLQTQQPRRSQRSSSTQLIETISQLVNGSQQHQTPRGDAPATITTSDVATVTTASINTSGGVKTAADVSDSTRGRGANGTGSCTFIPAEGHHPRNDNVLPDNSTGRVQQHKRSPECSLPPARAPAPLPLSPPSPAASPPTLPSLPASDQAELRRLRDLLEISRAENEICQMERVMHGQEAEASEQRRRQREEALRASGVDREPLVPQQRRPAEARPTLDDLRADKYWATGLRSGGPSDRELVSLLLTRVTQLEGQLTRARDALAEKEKELEMLKKEGVKPEDRRRRDRAEGDKSRRPAAAGDADELHRECRRLQRHVRDMEKFLADYGLEWVGSGGSSDDLTTARSQPDGDRSPTPGSPPREPFTVNFDLLAARVAELNALSGGDQQRLCRTPRGARFKPASPLPLTVYRDGILLESGPFRPYSDPLVQLLVMDLQDGYFPTELRHRFPDGAPIELRDLRHDKYRPPEVTRSFAGPGYRLGGRRRSSRLIAEYSRRQQQRQQRQRPASSPAPDARRMTSARRTPSSSQGLSGVSSGCDRSTSPLPPRLNRQRQGSPMPLQPLVQEDEQRQKELSTPKSVSSVAEQKQNRKQNSRLPVPQQHLLLAQQRQKSQSLTTQPRQITQAECSTPSPEHQSPQQRQHKQQQCSPPQALRHSASSTDVSGGWPPAPSQAVSRFLARLPKTVVRNGRLIEIRRSVEELLTGRASPPPAPEEEPTAAPPPEPRPATVRVRTPQDACLTLQLDAGSTVAELRRRIDESGQPQTEPYGLMAAFPRQMLWDDTLTLQECGLSPNGVVVMTRQSTA